MFLNSPFPKIVKVKFLDLIWLTALISNEKFFSFDNLPNEKKEYSVSNQSINQDNYSYKLLNDKTHPNFGSYDRGTDSIVPEESPIFNETRLSSSSQLFAGHQ